MKRLYPLSLLVFLSISGCVGTSHGPGEITANAAKQGIHGMNKEVVPELAGTWKLVSFHIQDPS
jgi:hypothetical protein